MLSEFGKSFLVKRRRLFYSIFKKNTLIILFENRIE